MGEHDRSSVVWDYVAVYQPGKLWDQVPPEPDFSGKPVVRKIGGTRNEIKRILKRGMASAFSTALPCN